MSTAAPSRSGDLIFRTNNNNGDQLSNRLHQITQKWSEAMDLLKCTSSRFDQEQTSSRINPPAYDCYASYFSETTRKMSWMDPVINSRSTNKSSDSNSELHTPYQIQSNSKLSYRARGLEQVSGESSEDKKGRFVDCCSNFSPNQVQSEMVCSSEFFRSAISEMPQSIREPDSRIPEQKIIVPVSLFCAQEEKRYTSGEESSDESQSVDLEDANRQILHFRAIMEKRQKDRVQEEASGLQDDEDLDPVQSPDDDEAVFETIQKIKIRDDCDERSTALYSNGLGSSTDSYRRILHGISGNAISLPPDYCFHSELSNAISIEVIQKLEVDNGYTEHEMLQLEQSRDLNVVSEEDSTGPISGKEKAKDYQLLHSPPASQASTALASNSSYAHDLLLRSAQVLRTCPSDEEVRTEAGLNSVSPKNRSLVQCPFDEDVAWNPHRSDRTTVSYSAPATTTQDSTNTLSNSIFSRMPAFKTNNDLEQKESKLNLYSRQSIWRTPLSDPCSKLLNSTQILPQHASDSAKDIWRDCSNSPRGSAAHSNLPSEELSSSMARNHQQTGIKTPRKISFTITNSATSSETSSSRPLERSHIKEMALSRIRSRDADRLRQKSMS